MKWLTHAVALAAARHALAIGLSLGLVVGFIGPELVLALGGQVAVERSVSWCRLFLLQQGWEALQ